jgi:hypothetical protein
MTDNPKDWFMRGTDNGERCYWITREGVVMLVVWCDGEVATRARVEIANIVAAWYRGEFFRAVRRPR